MSLESWKKCSNKYIRIIYNWHTLCLNANTAVKVVLKNSLLAFSPYRRNTPLVYTTHLLSKPLFILWCKHNLPNIRSWVSGVWISGILGCLSTAHTNSVKNALENHLCPPFSVSPCFLCFSGAFKQTEEDRSKHTFLGHLNNYLLRSHSFLHFYNCRLLYKAKSKMDPLLSTERNSSTADPRVTQLQIQVQCTWQI